MSPFLMRRKRLQAEMKQGHQLVVESGQEVIRNGDAHYKFRPNSDFLYLTGFSEPNAAIVIEKDNTTVFVMPKDAVKEMWNGKRLGVEQALITLDADKSYSYSNFNKTLYPCTRMSLQLLHRMRTVKDFDEVDNLTKSTRIAMEAHHRAMRLVTFKEKENNLQAIFDGKFTSSGVEHSYTPIVASGHNALCLHYTDNNKALEQGQLVLIDAGCEYKGYASDITRTFPVDGKFTQLQSELYEIVLNANKEVIRFIKAGVTMSQIDSLARGIICDGLNSLGYKNPSQYFPHGTSHFLGLDVHDVGDRDLPLKNGNVITVEPGIYIPELGIGIRIEDDILVLKDDSINLTEDLVKEVSDIEETILCPLT
mgnify:CR=1 FL=1|tara:strand:+ start:881 stop:1978 length:1098 start_codon:yes stop_codon:yes gene_type:complete